MPEEELPLPEEAIPEAPRPRRLWVPALVLLVAGSLLALLIPGLLPREGTGSGTGFIVGEGYVLTAAHVADGAVSITVYRDGRPYRATVVEANLLDDLALLSVERLPGLSPLPWAPRLEGVGDPVVAVGHPHGTAHPVARWTAVAGLGGSGPLRLVLYTADPFAKGYSGAPLVDRAGQVVGVVTGNVSTSGVEFGMATPASRAASWLAGLGVSLPLAFGGDSLPQSEVEARVQGSVVRIEARFPPGAR